MSTPTWSLGRSTTTRPALSVLRRKSMPCSGCSVSTWLSAKALVAGAGVALAAAAPSVTSTARPCNSVW